MGPAIRAICVCYSFLLIFYPRRLRIAYGAEMVDTLRDELQERRGVAQVTGRAVWEIVTVGIPAKLNEERCGVAPVAAGTCFAGWYVFLSVLHDPSALNAFMRRCLGVHCP